MDLNQSASTDNKLNVIIESLRKSEERYRKMIAEVEDYAIILLDQNGIIQNWNKGAEKIIGYKDTVVGKHFSVFYRKEDIENGLPAFLLKEAAEKGKATQEGWQTRKDGTDFWVGVSITALHADDQSIIGYSTVTRDLTDHKNSLEKMKESEERYYKMIAEVQDYAIILLDGHGRIENWNAGAQRIKQYRAQEVVGKHFSIFYTNEDKSNQLPAALLAQATSEGKASQEGWRVRKDGTQFFGSTTITALHNNANEIIGFSKVTRDLSDRKEAEDRQAQITEQLKTSNAELIKSEERYHKMIEEVQDYAIILLDPDGRIENWNAGAQVIKGYSSEIIGANFSIFYTPEDRAKKLPQTLLQQAILYGKANHEGWRVRKEGSQFWGSIVITALHNKAGELIGFTKVTRDLTEKKQAEDKLLAYNLELERKNSELEKFAYIASHDLQEPLRKIRTFTSLVTKHRGNTELVSRYFIKINQAAERMSNLINSVLEYSRLGEANNQSERVDLNRIVSQVLIDFELLIAEKQANISCGELPIILANHAQMEQLFSNLISNALKFNATLPDIRIDFTVVKSEAIKNYTGSLKDEKYIAVVITDNGIGFEPEYAELIFTMFQRLKDKHDYTGTGIGLALCKRIMENHQGFITTTSKPGNGASFYLYFPAGKDF